MSATYRPPRHRRSIRQTFRRYYSLVAALTGLVLILSLLLILRLNTLQNVEARLDGITRLQVSSAKRWLDDRLLQLRDQRLVDPARQVLRTAPARSEEADQDQARFQDTLAAIDGLAMDFDLLLLVDPENIVRAGTDPAWVGQPFERVKPTWLQQAPPEGYSAPLVYNQAAGRLELFLLLPLYDADQRLGTLVALPELSAIQTLLEEAGQSTVDGQAYFITIDGDLVGADLVGQRASRSFLPLEAGLQGRSDFGTYNNAQGQFTVGAYRWVERLSTVMVVEQDGATILAFARTDLFILASLSLVILAFWWLFDQLITRKVLQPIQTLTEVAVVLADGRMPPAIRLQTNDELETLAETLQHLTRQLQDSISNLEAQVSQRTQAMQTSADIGQRIIEILDLDSLLQDVVSIIQQTLEYQMVLVWLLDERGELVAQAGAGAQAQAWVAEGRRVKPGSLSLVGQAALGKLQQIQQTANHQSQLALPLQRGHELWGVLEVLTPIGQTVRAEDTQVLESIVDQLTIAFRNATLYFESEAARLRNEALVNDLQKTSQDLAHRTMQLRTAVEVAKDANSILDMQTLAEQVVDRIKLQFGLYYVGLFLVDDTGQWAVLEAGSSEVGRRLVAQGHRLPLDETSMVAWAIHHKTERISLDTAQDPVRFANPLLPETRSELALPLISRGDVLGALTIQSKIRHDFTAEDVDVLQVMADQIAAALQNAALFSQARASRERFLDLYNRAPNGYHTLDARGTLLEINDTALRMLQRSDEREAIVGQVNLETYLTSESRAAFKQALSQLRQKIYISNLELDYIRRDGTVLPVRMIAAAHNNAAGEVEIYTAVQDISARKEVEAAQEALLAETTTLYELSQALLGTETQADIFDVSLSALAFVNPERGVWVLQVQGQPDPETLNVVSYGPSEGNPDVPVPKEQSYGRPLLDLLALVSPGETLVVEDTRVSKDEIQQVPLSLELQTLLQEWGVGAFVLSAIGSRGHLSHLLLIAYSGPEAIQPAYRRFIDGVARQMSISLDNQQLLSSAQQQAGRLEAAARVAKNTTSEITLDRLLPQTVELVREVFDYDYVAVFLVDEYQQYAVLQAGTAPIGTQLLAEDYRLPLDAHSLVGIAIAQEQVKIATVGQDEVSLTRHPLLSETSSEVALPLMVRGTVLGALDVQSCLAQAFDHREVVALQTIADQLANAIHIARLFEREHRSTREIQELHRRYLREEWEQFVHRQGQTWAVAWGGRDKDNTQRHAAALDDLLVRNPVVGQHRFNGDDVGAQGYVSPLTLRGQIIGRLGVLQQPEQDWSEDDLAIIEGVAAQAALALENARLIEETQQRATQLQISAEISQTVSASLDVEALIQESVDLIQQKFDFATVRLTLFHPDDEATVYCRRAGDTEAIRSRDTLAESDLVRQVAARRQTRHLQRHQTGAFASQFEAHPQALSLLAVPLIVFSHPSGVLEIYTSRAGGFTTDMVTVLEILATQLAISIENARAYQEQQATNEKLRQVDKLKTQFLANMSHELRTPLNSIIGFSRVILKGIDGPLTDLQKTDLTAIHQSGQHLLGLINDILDLAKIEAGKLELSFTQVDLNHLLNSVVTTTIGLVKDKSITVHKNIVPDLPVISADETRVRQILINLLSNAAKFTEKGSITVSAQATETHVHFSVADTGIGISAEDLDTIFEEFAQVDASTTRRAGGTGLGLPITRRFVEMHRGEISVESEAGVGSTFRVSLPIQPFGVSLPLVPHDDDTSAPSRALRETQTLAVLDRDANVVDLYRRYLRQTHYQVVELDLDAEVLAQVEELQPHAILMDVLLPGGNSRHLIRRLQQNPNTTHIPLIVSSLVDQSALGDMPVAAYLTKPILQADLLAALESLAYLTPAPRRVLVVDDEADDAQLLQRILETQPYQVTTVNNGLDGLEIIYNNPPDLVVIDLSLPGLDGFAIIDSLRQNPKTKAIPVVVVTGRDLSAREQDRLAQQSDACLVKGQFGDVDLINCVSHFLN